MRRLERALQWVHRIFDERTAMQTERARISTMPSALLLRNLVAGHGGTPPREALEQAGFSSSEIEMYLRQRETRCNASS
jgi:hypothetical protein